LERAITPNTVLHRTAIPLRSIAAADLVVRLKGNAIFIFPRVQNKFCTPYPGFGAKSAFAKASADKYFVDIRIMAV